MSVIYFNLRCIHSNYILDVEDQLEEFRKDPAKLAKYSRDIEGELKRRFTLVSNICSDETRKNSKKQTPDAQDQQRPKDFSRPGC